MSVILVVDCQRERGARALRSLVQQSPPGEVEVLVLDLGWHEYPPLPGSEHPAVRVLGLDRGIGFGVARTRGVLEARAPIVAFLEEHCLALPGWVEAHMKAHRGPVAAVGGELHSATPGEGLTELISVLGSGPWTPPARRGRSAILPGNNTSYGRDVLRRYREDLPTLLANETLLNIRLLRDGYLLWIEPSAKYVHAFEGSTRYFCEALFWYAWVGEATRSKFLRWSAARRAWRAGVLIATLAVRPAWGVVRLLWARPHRWRVIVPNIPAYVLGYWTGMLGRILGLVLGLRRADVYRLDHDVNVPRRSGSPTFSPAVR